MALKEEQQNIIIGQDKNNFLAIQIDMQKNHFKMEFKKLTKVNLEEVLENYNSINWVDKISTLLKHHEIDFDIIPLDIIELKFKTILTKEFKSFIRTLKKNNYCSIEDEYEENLQNYKGNSIYIVKWLYSFANKIIDESVMDIVPEIINKIQIVKVDECKDYTKNKYFLYMGKNENYKGCIGEIINLRKNSKTTYLIYFPGKKNEKCSGKLWCSESSLVHIL